MFYFIKFDTPSKSAAYDKGVLFEQLCKTLLEACGYTDIDMRVKTNNLEYDIVAKDSVTSQKLIGEAKAWDKKMSSEVLAFTGKMLHYWLKNKDTWGIFISVSDLTSDVKQQIDDMINEHYHLRYIVGDNIINTLVAQKKYASIDQIKERASQFTKMHVSDTYFLVSDRGNYYIQLVIEIGNSLPTYFICYDAYGNLIVDKDFISILKNKLDILKELTAYEESKTPMQLHLQELDSDTKERSFLGVLHGEGWFDYQFPANPDKFIGRSGIISVFDDFIAGICNANTPTKVIEILSRSGVGKSSIALKLQRIYSDKMFPTTLADSRNIRSDIDILQVFQNLIIANNTYGLKNVEVPQSRKEMFTACEELDNYLAQDNRLALIILDQFESIFSRPQIFNTILDIILEFSVRFKHFAFVIARKNDQPTTYDESSEIDLNRLKSISKPIVLQDFKTEEALELISHINDEIGTSLIKTLKEQVLEISNGFPWLLKKYCAHIIKLVSNGAKQTSIVESGMQLEDLFNEDILALDETIREFFNRLIYFLPATYSELSEAFNDEDLAIKLRILQNDYRLIRLTGRTYDTYNDILKEFMKTGHVNLTRRYLIRYTPTTVIKLLKCIIQNDCHNVDDVLKVSKQGQGSIINILGELRKLKMIEGSNNNFCVNGLARTAYNDNNLLKHISNILINNSIIKKIITELNKANKLSFEQIANILKEEMPFIDAGDNIWLLYSKTMCKWIENVGWAQLRNNYIIKPIGDSAILSECIEDVFFPTTMISQVELVLNHLAANENGMTIPDLKKEMKRSSLNGHLADAYFLGLVSPISRSEYQISEEGKKYLSLSPEEKGTFIKVKTENLDNVKRYLELLKDFDSLDAFKKLLEELKIDRWNDTSIKWKHKILRNWLMFSKQVSRRKK